jgi:hypothetical protein
LSFLGGVFWLGFLLPTLAVQEDGGDKSRVPLSAHARRLSPSESRRGKLEKEALAVIWAVSVNRGLLFGEKDVVVGLCDAAVIGMLTPGEAVTQPWVDQLAAVIEPLPRLQLIKPKENPALALGSGMAAGQLAEPAFDTLDLMQALFTELFQALKLTGTARAKWLGAKAKKERRLRRERVLRGESEVSDLADVDMEELNPPPPVVGGPTVASATTSEEDKVKEEEEQACSVPSVSAVVNPTSVSVVVNPTSVSAVVNPTCIVDEGEDPAWYRELLLERAQSPTVPETPAASFEDMELYFDRMIHLADRKVRETYISRCIAGATFGQCWRLATGGSFEQLTGLYEQHVGRGGPALLETALRQLLQQNDQENHHDQSSLFVIVDVKCCGSGSGRMSETFSGKNHSGSGQLLMNWK